MEQDQVYATTIGFRVGLSSGSGKGDYQISLHDILVLVVDGLLKVWLFQSSSFELLTRAEVEVVQLIYSTLSDLIVTDLVVLSNPESRSIVRLNTLSNTISFEACALVDWNADFILHL